MLTAILLVALLGFVSLGTEMGFLMFDRRKMQSAADSAALGAVAARIKGNPADYKEEAFALAAAGGYRTGKDGTTVAVNAPPASGSYAGRSDAVEVVITQPQSPVLASLFHSGAFVLRARAVAQAKGYGACVLALDGSASGSFSTAGSLVANFTDCWVADNSSSSQAVQVSGGATVNAEGMTIVGGYSKSSNSTINTTAGIDTNQAATADPYAGVEMPQPGTCSADGYALASYGQQTIMPGTYCNGISVSGGATLTLSPGVYIIDRGSLSVSGNSTLTGDGVTIVLTSSTGSSYATVSIAGGATVNLTPPDSGPTAGMVFFQDRNATASGVNYLTGGSNQTIMGALYFPNQNITFTGASKNSCTEIIGRTVTIAGGTNLAANCLDTSVAPIIVRLGRLVE